MIQKKKIALITPLLQPYRISFYEKLGALYPFFRVFYGYTDHEQGRPGYKGATSFESCGFMERSFKFMRFNVVYLIGMFRAIEDYNPDIIITQGIPGNVTFRRIVNWAHTHDKIIIFWYCGWEPNSKRNRFLMEVKKLLAKRYYSKGTYFLTYSTNAALDIMNLGIPEWRIGIAYNGIELDLYSDILNIEANARDIAKYHRMHENKIFLFVGGLLPEKRVDLLIASFVEFSRNFDDTVLWIIGDGPDRDKVMNAVEKHTRIFYFGRIITDVEAYFSLSDFYVLPGTGGLGLNQAMYFGSVPICGRADGTEDDLVIEDKTGFRFAEDDSKSLHCAMLRAYNCEHETLDLFRSNGRKIVMERSNVNYMVKVFNNLISKQ